MSKFEVLVIETDGFGWNRRLEETVVFASEEAAKAFQAAYNAEEHIPDVEGNIMVALFPQEIKEKENG